MEFVHLQLNTFLVLLLSGMIWGAFFDLYRVFRNYIKVTPAIDAIGDIFFWILAAILIIPFIYWATWMELRLFVWISMLLGLIIYFSCLSSFFIPFFKVFWQTVSWFPGIIINIIWRLKLGLERLIRSLRRRNY
jgi:spore cortex biosynthesis protein YabQ